MKSIQKTLDKAVQLQCSSPTRRTQVIFTLALDKRRWS